MKFVHWIVTIIVIIGAINWGLVGLFNYNIVTALFGSMDWLVKTVYVVVGVCGILLLFTSFMKKD